MMPLIPRAPGGPTVTTGLGDWADDGPWLFGLLCTPVWPREEMAKYLRGLLARVERKDTWQMAEAPSLTCRVLLGILLMQDISLCLRCPLLRSAAVIGKTTLVPAVRLAPE